MSILSRLLRRNVCSASLGSRQPLPDYPKWLPSNVAGNLERPGCDFNHWYVEVAPPGKMTRARIIGHYACILARVIGGSYEQARMSIYSVSTRHFFAFGALVSQDLAHKLKVLPEVYLVLPDSYLHVEKQKYGGEPVINGEEFPYDLKYHEEWVRENPNAFKKSLEMPQSFSFRPIGFYGETRRVRNDQ